MDEFTIAALVADGAPIDGYGVGTSLGVGAGSAEHGVAGGALGGVYKAVQYIETDGTARPLVKVAGDKSTWPGVKEVYRLGSFDEDLIQLASEPRPTEGTRLLRPVVQQGEVLPGSVPPLSEIRELAQQNLAALPADWKALQAGRPYPVRFSDELQALRRAAAQEQSGEGAPE
jgi:nicotinate phosphoribosyltransferase